nr:type II secretion system F family protein [Photobacterium aquae]
MWIALSFFLFCLALFFLDEKAEDNKRAYFQQMSIVELKNMRQAVNVKAFQQPTLWQRVQNQVRPVLAMLGERAKWVVFSYVTAVLLVVWYVNYTLLDIDSQWVSILVPCIFYWLGWSWLVNKRRRDFEQTFPDVLNIMMSAITAGDSLMQAICYVGDNVENRIGKEFKTMGERFKLGESPDIIFERACKNYPYPAFLFFVVTIRANISRGGSLKNVLARLIRVLIDARKLEKKKMAITSESRISAKIVAAIPLIFLIIINEIKPQNVDFILNHPDGRFILYYALGSECLGFIIIWLIMRGVR